MGNRFFTTVFFVFVINLSFAQKWETIIEMGGNIFPSYILATANNNSLHNFKQTKLDSASYQIIGDNMGTIGVKISELPDNANVKIEISENEVLYSSSIEEKISLGNKAYLFYPKIRYKFEQLRNTIQQKPINVEFKLYVDNNLIGTKFETASIRPLEECPFYVKSTMDDSFVSTHWMFSAYVNEDSPVINEILAKALKTGIVNQFNGYQGDEQNTINQVWSIWYTFQELSIKYSNIANTSLSSDQIYSQRVRMIDQSYNYSQASCVDGSVLFASVLKAIGIDPFLVLIPGHMFLGYYIDKSHTKVACLETTMIGSVDLNNIKQNQLSANTVNKLNQAKLKLQEISQFQIGRTQDEKDQAISRQNKRIEIIQLEAKKDASYRSFNSAINVGGQNYYKHKSNFKLNIPNYQIIDIAELRKMVKPIWR